MRSQYTQYPYTMIYDPLTRVGLVGTCVAVRPLCWNSRCGTSIGFIQQHLPSCIVSHDKKDRYNVKRQNTHCYPARCIHHHPTRYIWTSQSHYQHIRQQCMIHQPSSHCCGSYDCTERLLKRAIFTFLNQYV